MFLSPFKSLPFRSLTLFHSFTPSCHAGPIVPRKEAKPHGRGNVKEKRPVEQTRRKGRDELQTTNKFWSKFRSGSSGYEVGFKQKSPPPSKLLCLHFLYPWGSYHLSLLLMPASSFHTSANPGLSSPFPLRPRVALCCTVCFLDRSLPSCSYLPRSLTHSALPQALCCFSPATDERRGKWRSAC